MTEVVSVKFNCHGKAYFFAPGDIKVKAGDKVIVETAKGLDIGECAIGNREVEDDVVVQPLRPVVRIATEADLRTAENNKIREKEAFEICREKIAQHELDMKLVDVECSFEGNKILFFFTSDGRVDFRELVKDLAGVFRTRIELRQIGVRDETKMLGGLGICGRPYCCNQFLNDFEPVSTKMAKTQSMSLNPTKISGSCGRLMCCLRYEQDAYEELVKTIPKNGAFVQTTEGYGNVIQTNVLRQKVRVRMDSEGVAEVKSFDADQVAAIPGGRPKPGEAMPDVLVYVEKPKEALEPEEDPWKAPNLFAGDEPVKEKQPAPAAAEENSEEKKKPRNRNRNRNHNGPRKPAEGGAAPNAGAPRPQNGNRPRQEGAPRPQNGAPRPQGGNQPKPQNAGGQNGQPKAAGQGGGNNRNRNHRRPNNNRPKPQGGGQTPAAGSAPKQ